jgi:excisionase family DNA binding protein
MTNPRIERLALTIPEAVAASGFGRTTLYDAMRRGELATVRRGRAVRVLRSELARWLDSLTVRSGAREDA